jgi:tyrosine aminotransferase
MENGSELEKWGFRGNEKLNLALASAVTVRGILMKLFESLSKDDPRPTVPLGHGDPSAFPCFRTAAVAEDAIIDAVRSAKYNGYAPTVGILPARR